MKRSSSGFGWVEIVLVLAVVALVSGAGYLFYHNSDHVSQTKPKPPVASNQEELINSVPAAAAAVTSTTDLDKATQTINELDLDGNEAQLQQLEDDLNLN